MQTRRLSNDDYNELCQWWAAWGWEAPVPKDFLSDTGIMVSEENVNICAGFLYTISNAPVGWFTFPVSNPAIRGVARKKAIQIMISEIEKIAKDNGIKYLYSSLRIQSMIDAQKSAGFIEANKNNTELIKII